MPRGHPDFARDRACCGGLWLTSAMETSAQIEAAQARKADAEVSFKTGVFVEETLTNAFGTLATPYVIWRHGFIGARNRMFWGTGALPVYTFVTTAALIAMLTLHGIYHGQPGYSITNFEVIVVCLLYLLRCCTIGVKYSLQSSAQLAELGRVILPGVRILETLVLVGWVSPTPYLLFGELERAMMRVAPTMCTHKLLH